MAQAGACKGRILVVDDDRLVLATVTHGLSQAGYEVIDADNGDDAILLAREHRPALALLDIRMEGKSGFDVAQTLRDAYRIPFMFLSAFSDEATLAQVKALGALAYLIKPLVEDELLAAAVLADPLPLAVGVLMHRHSLSRAQAWQRLQRLAQEQELPLAEQAQRLLTAVEELARTAA